MNNEWLIEENEYKPEKELIMETLFALSNGYMGCRGTLEEGRVYSEIKQCFGTYAAGIFDKYNKEYQAIVNLPYLFDTRILINGSYLDITKNKISNYKRYLDMYNGLLIRNFSWIGPKKEKIDFEITRFLSKAESHLAVLFYKIKSTNFNGKIEIENILNGNVSNIDFHVSGYQLRDEKYFFISEDHEKSEIKNGAYLLTKTKQTQHQICQAFKVMVKKNGNIIDPTTKTEIQDRYVKKSLTLDVKEDIEYSFLKPIAVFTSNDNVEDIKKSCENTLDESLKKDFSTLLSEHIIEWNKTWEISDIKIEGSKKDQQSIRFNIFHLIQMGNKNNPKVNIGSRGLTSEMHYGNCFWDTEIFILPFFIYTDPDTAQALVEYRYHTLPEARDKAKKLWFNGAMYPWMSSYPGKEQADYWEYANIAVHIVSDVTFGLISYFDATNDIEFMLNYGLEILIETSRFWASRAYYNDRIKKYVINTVKGPNEYDGVVNNNTYTNWSAQWNLKKGKEIVDMIKETYPDQFKKIAKKINFNIKETNEWEKIIKDIYINYDEKKDLYIEDDMFLDKRPIELKKMKPGKKITTELDITWDTILRHRVVKQADVLLLMTIHRNSFTREQVLNAWNFYEPLTLHDSSLSYNTHSIVAAELGFKKKSYDYFKQTAELDIDDLMENSFLGIHSANAGGTWQCVINGFCGMRLQENRVEFTPNLPDQWKSVSFKIYFRNNLFKIDIEKNNVSIELVRSSKLNNVLTVSKNKIFFEK